MFFFCRRAPGRDRLRATVLFPLMEKVGKKIKAPRSRLTRLRVFGGVGRKYRFLSSFGKEQAKIRLFSALSPKKVPLHTRLHRTPPLCFGRPLQFPAFVPRKPWRVPPDERSESRRQASFCLAYAEQGGGSRTSFCPATKSPPPTATNGLLASCRALVETSQTERPRP